MVKKWVKPLDKTTLTYKTYAKTICVDANGIFCHPFIKFKAGIVARITWKKYRYRYKLSPATTYAPGRQFVP